MELSFVIPCYRSEGTIASVVDEIRDTVHSLHIHEYEIILVNDCSPDNTFEKICALAQSDPHITGINLAKNFGQHGALMAGFHLATGDIIICLDDDGQTPANETGKLLEEIRKGYDVVYASYSQKKENIFRRAGSSINSKMAEIMLGKPKDLEVNSYFAMRNFVMQEMIRYEHCYPYVVGLVLRSTKNVSNVAVKHRERAQGSSGYTIHKLLSLWFNGFTSFSVKPLRIATYAGFVCAAIGFCYLAYIVASYFLVHSAPLGWSSTVAILLILGGLILLVLGMIGEYVGRIYMCINATPQYVIREVTRNHCASD